MPYEDMVERLRHQGFSVEDALRELAGEGPGSERPALAHSALGRELPFAYVFGRSSFAVSFYGANVYPENVSVALERPHIAPSVTGKFVLEVQHDERQDAYLSLTVELAESGPADGDAFWEHEFASVVEESVRLELERLNSEFSHYVPAHKAFRSPAPDHW